MKDTVARGELGSCVGNPQLCISLYEEGFTFWASSLEMKEGSMPWRMLYLDFQSFSSLDFSSQAMKNSRDLSISSPSKIQQLSILLIGR